MNQNSGYLRAAFLFVGAFNLVFAIGFALQMSWATALWPWADGRLSYMLVSSILAAIAASVIWIGVSQEWGAAEAGSLNLAFTFGGAALWLLFLGAQAERQYLLLFGTIGLVTSVLSVGVALWSRRRPLRDPRPTPRPVRASFAVFMVALVVVGSLLVLQTPNILPWVVKPESSVLFGCFFLGAAVYFAYGLFRPRWHFAKGQLAGFLAYDVVLLPVFVPFLPVVRPEHTLSLIVYVAVLVYSAGLAVYYLFLNPGTRAAPSKEVAV